MLTDLGSLILGENIVHLHQLLLVGSRDVRVDAWEELDGGELSREAVTVDQTLDHAHDDLLEVSDPDQAKYFLHAFRGLFAIDRKLVDLEIC